MAFHFISQTQFSNIEQGGDTHGFNFALLQRCLSKTPPHPQWVSNYVCGGSHPKNGDLFTRWWGTAYEDAGLGAIMILKTTRLVFMPSLSFLGMHCVLRWER